MPEFTEKDQRLVRQFMEEHPFITLISHDGVRPVATQVPVLIKERKDALLLTGHIMKSTDHHQALLKNDEALALFQGPNCYVSSGWYTQRMGGTWNYQTVHVRGKIRLLDAPATLGILVQLTNHFEQGRPLPQRVEDLPDTYVIPLLQAIAGFEIEVTDIQAIFKLSQNRDDESYVNIVQHLEAADINARLVAHQMRLKRPELTYDTSLQSAAGSEQSLKTASGQGSGL